MIAGNVSGSDLTSRLFESLSAEISLSAISAKPIPGAATIKGRDPPDNCRTRRRTMLTSRPVSGMTALAEARR